MRNALSEKKMQCPRTNNSLKRIDLDGLAIDVSESYGGVFFDNYELEKFDESHEYLGSALVDHLEACSESSSIDVEQRINCPKCINVVMMRRFYSPQRLLAVDECPACAGIWLDAGELAYLREIFISKQRSDSMFEKTLRENNFPPAILAPDKSADDDYNRNESQSIGLFSRLMKHLFKF